MRTRSARKLRIGVIDFFSGCGGSGYGFSKANVDGASIEIVAGIDIDPHCCATYSRMIRVPAIELDVVRLAYEESKLDNLLRDWQLERFDKTMLIGCAPCQGFAAHRKAVKGSDRRRSLFPVFCSLVKKIKPDGIFMENVPDLFSKRHWKYYQEGCKILEAAGYHVRSRIYNFASFGLPQERFRAVMMCLRHPFNMPEPVLGHEQFRTVRQTISSQPPIESGGVSLDDPMHIVSHHRPCTIRILEQIPIDGGNRPVGVGPECLDRARDAHGGYTDVYGRLAWDKPAVTITARCRTPSCGRFAHPEQNRGLSVREAALLQGFPPDFMFEGPFDDKYKQIGNAVPPIVAKFMAEHLIRAMIQGAVDAQGYDSDITCPIGPGFAVTINGIKRKRIREVASATT